MKLFALLSLLFAVPAFAGQATNVTSLGFSADGAHYAFVKWGSSDGSGAAFASSYIVDVKANKYVDTFSYREDDTAVQAPAGDVDAAIAKVIKGVKLSKYKIKAYNNLGTDLLVRALSDKSTFKDTTFTASGDAEGGAGPVFRRYTLSVTESAAAPDATCVNPPQLLKLTLQGEDKGKGATSVVLQEDKSLPSSRSCAEGYAVRRVTVYKDALVVMVSYTAPGFEGADVEQIAVTGQQHLDLQ